MSSSTCIKWLCDVFLSMKCELQTSEKHNFDKETIVENKYNK